MVFIKRHNVCTYVYVQERFWFYNNFMDKNNILAALDNGELTIKDLDIINKDEYCALPIMDLSSFGNEIVNQLTSIGTDVLNDILNGNISNVADLKKSLKSNTLSRFGLEIKRNKNRTKKNLKDINSMELTEFAVFSAILVVINSKLTDIIAREKAIVEFLEIDKQTALKADFLTLNTIVREYHHNFDNEKFLHSREAQVIEIRRNAEHNVLFYKELAEKRIAGFKKGVHIEVDKALNEIQTRFKYYRLALYIYAYSSFLDVVLLENFSEEFVNSIIEDITNHSTQYIDFYNETSKTVKQMAEKSGKSQAMKGVSSITSAFSKLFSKMKANKQADKLENSSKSMAEKRESSVEDLVTRFSDNKDAGVDDVIENLNYLKNLYNKESDVIIDSEYIYIKRIA